jgi:hypothetical protein
MDDLESGPDPQFNTKLPRDLQDRVKAYCALAHTRIQDFTRQALEEKLERVTRSNRFTSKNVLELRKPSTPRRPSRR